MTWIRPARLIGKVTEKPEFVDVAEFAYLAALKSAPRREVLQEKLVELGYDLDQ